MGSSTKEYREETELVLRAQYGDLAAFDALVVRYRPGALVLARQIVRQREVAEDVVQDSFLAAYKAFPQLRDPQRFASWFGSIVRHRARRMIAGERPSHLSVDDLILCHSPALSQEMDVRADAARIQCALEELPPEIRPIMELHYLEEWTVTQISEFLASPATTVKWRLHAGRKLMRKTLSHLMENTNESGK